MTIISTDKSTEARRSFSLSNSPRTYGRHPRRELDGRPAYDDLGSLLSTYGSASLCFVAREPRRLFAYWDVDLALYPTDAMKDGLSRFFLKVLRNGELESILEIEPTAPNWYIAVEQPNAVYEGELGYFDAADEWTPIARSNETRTPSDSMSDDHKASFATVPLHLNFQQMIDLVQSEASEDEGLVGTLSRLQTGGGIPSYTEEQKRLLASLFGNIDLTNLSSAEIEQLLRKELAERLSTESASELFAKFGPEVSSLFSGILGSLALSESSISLFSGLLGRSLSLSETSSISLFSGLLGGSLALSETSSSLFSGILGLETLSSESRGLFSGLIAEVLGGSSSLSSAFAGWGASSSPESWFALTGEEIDRILSEAGSSSSSWS